MPEKERGWKDALKTAYLNPLTSGPAVLYALAQQAKGNAARTLSNPEESLGNIAQQLTPPINDPEALAQYALNFSPIGGVAGMIVGKNAKGFKDLRQFSDLYSKMPKAEISDAEAQLTEALKSRLAKTKSIDLSTLEKEAGAGNYSPAEVHRQLADFKGQYPSGPLEAFLNHPELYNQYPEVAKSKVNFIFSNPKARGSYNPAEQSITLNLHGIKDEEDLMNTLLHEIQHGIQEKEGFVGGASPDFYQEAKNNMVLNRIASGKAPAPKGLSPEEIRSAPLDLYNRTIGEVEARDTVARKALTNEQRMAHMPYESQNIPVGKSVNPLNWVNAAQSAESTPITPKDIIESLGLEYKGVTPAEQMHGKSAGHWFNDPETGSTHLIHEDDLTPENLLFKVMESRAKFGIGG